MLKKLAGFHDAATDFFESGNHSVSLLTKRFFPTLFLIFFVSFFAVYQMKFDSYIRLAHERIETIDLVLKEQGEAVLQDIEGRMFEASEGVIQTHRVHGSESTYLFFFTSQDAEKPYVYNDSTNKWVNESLIVPPLITQAFIVNEIGVPTKYEDGTVWVDEDTYQVEANDFRVIIKDGSNKEITYAPLPSLSSRVKKFIQKERNIQEDNVELVHFERNQDRELLYFLQGDNVYQLEAFFNDSASIGKVEGLNVK